MFSQKEMFLSMRKIIIVSSERIILDDLVERRPSPTRTQHIKIITIEDSRRKYVRHPAFRSYPRIRRILQFFKKGLATKCSIIPVNRIC
jgi:hypothetical protein